jgi:hypothetical protein
MAIDISVQSAYAYFTGQRNAVAASVQPVASAAAPVASSVVLPKFLQDTYTTQTTTSNTLLAQAQAVIAQLEQRVAQMEAQARGTTTVAQPQVLSLPNSAQVYVPQAPIYAPTTTPIYAPTSTPLFGTTPGYGAVGTMNTGANQITYAVNAVAQTINQVAVAFNQIGQAFKGIKF